MFRSIWLVLLLPLREAAVPVDVYVEYNRSEHVFFPIIGCRRSKCRFAAAARWARRRRMSETARASFNGAPRPRPRGRCPGPRCCRPSSDRAPARAPPASHGTLVMRLFDRTKCNRRPPLRTSQKLLCTKYYRSVFTMNNYNYGIFNTN